MHASSSSLRCLIRLIAFLDNSGSLQAESERICGFVATFYAELYGHRTQDTTDLTILEVAEGTAWTTVSSIEVTQALARLMGTGAEDGLVAEILKTSHQAFVDATPPSFSDVLAGGNAPSRHGKRAGQVTINFHEGHACPSTKLMTYLNKSAMSELYTTAEDPGPSGKESF